MALSASLSRHATSPAMRLRRACWTARVIRLALREEGAKVRAVCTTVCAVYEDGGENIYNIINYVYTIAS